MTNYYVDQLATIKTESPFPYQIKIINGDGYGTKWLSLNSESAKALVDFIIKQFPNISDQFTTP